MLERTTLGSPLSPPEVAPTESAAPAQVAPWLQYFLLLMIVVSAIACAFVWQANAINDVRVATDGLRKQAAVLEQQNARLMVQLAAFDSPARVKSEAARLGMRSTRPPEVRIYAAVASAAPQISRQTQTSDQLASWADEIARLAQRNPIINAVHVP